MIGGAKLGLSPEGDPYHLDWIHHKGMEIVLQRLGLSETTWEDARVKDEKLGMRGI